MFTFDEIADMLDSVAEEIPQAFYNELNGGVNLVPQEKLHAEARQDDLYILGEYHHYTLARYIVIYYGSIAAAYPHYDSEQMRARLKKLLLHEFTHHIESLAGEHGLEDKDDMHLESYKKRVKKLKVKEKYREK